MLLTIYGAAYGTVFHHGRLLCNCDNPGEGGCDISAAQQVQMQQVMEAAQYCSSSEIGFIIAITTPFRSVKVSSYVNGIIERH